MNLVFKKMEEEDAKEVAAIECMSFSSPWSFSSFLERVSNPRCYDLLAKIEDKVVGYICVDVIEDEGHITNLAVLPHLRRQGIGKNLLSAVLKAAGSLKIKKFILEVREKNTVAQRLYRGFGFEVISRRKKYYSDTDEDALIMEKKV